MALWTKKIEEIKNSAISKSKNLMEVTTTKLNISELEAKIKDLKMEIGIYAFENRIGNEDSKLSEYYSKILSYINEIDEENKKLEEIKVSEQQKKEQQANHDTSLAEPTNKKLCPTCNSEIDEESAFCGNCGTKI